MNDGRIQEKANSLGTPPPPLKLHKDGRWGGGGEVKKKRALSHKCAMFYALQLQNSGSSPGRLII